MRSIPTLAVALPLCAALLACGSSGAPSPTPSADTKAQAEQAEASEPALRSPKAATDEATAPAAKPKFPPEARRDEPPAELLANAVKVGTKAPTFTLDGSTGSVDLGDALGKADYVVLVFYRGGW